MNQIKSCADWIATDFLSFASLSTMATEEERFGMESDNDDEAIEFATYVESDDDDEDPFFMADHNKKSSTLSFQR